MLNIKYKKNLDIPFTNRFIYKLKKKDYDNWKLISQKYILKYIFNDETTTTMISYENYDKGYIKDGEYHAYILGDYPHDLKYDYPNKYYLTFDEMYKIFVPDVRDIYICYRYEDFKMHDISEYVSLEIVEKILNEKYDTYILDYWMIKDELIVNKLIQIRKGFFYGICDNCYIIWINGYKTSLINKDIALDDVILGNAHNDIREYLLDLLLKKLKK
jgi:hypothetical protein